MSVIKCQGWWEQAAYGRQEMHDLQLSMHNGVISGSGTDIIHDFTLAGKISEQGAVEIVKQYRDRHSVLYVGRYDGEGAMFGDWHISGFTGKWWLKFQGPASIALDDMAIDEVLPQN